MTTALEPSAQTTTLEPTALTVPAPRTESDLAVVSTTAPVEIIPPDALQSRSRSMLEMLRGAENGAHYVEEATKLAALVTKKDRSALLSYSHEARTAMDGVADQIIGNATIGNTGAVGALFSDINRAKETLNVEALSTPPGLFGSTMLKIADNIFPFLKEFARRTWDPVVSFIERYKKIKPMLDAKEQELIKEEAARIQSQKHLESLKDTILKGFRTVEVTIAAGEIALAREHAEFNQALEAFNRTGDKGDIVRLTELSDWRKSILALDNKLMTIQVSRTNTGLSVPVVDQAIQGEESLRSSLEDTREFILKNMRLWVAIGKTSNDQLQAAELANQAQDAAAQARATALNLMGKAQEATAALGRKSAESVTMLVEDMKKFTNIVTRGADLIKENERLNKEARTALRNAEQAFKGDLLTALNELAK